MIADLSKVVDLTADFWENRFMIDDGMDFDVRAL